MPRPVPIGAFTRDLAGLFRPAIERTKLKLVIDCEEDNDRACYVDPDLYEKILLNLIGGFRVGLKVGAAETDLVGAFR